MNNFNNLQKAITARDSDLLMAADDITQHYGDKKPLVLNLNVGKEKFMLPCADIYAYQCAADTLKQKAMIAALVNSNKAVMNRYLQITKLPNYNVHFYGMADPVPSYQYAIQLSNMRLAQALIAFDAGDMSQGFALLEEEVTFTKRVLTEDQNLIGQMIAIRQLFTTYHTISMVMDMPVMHKYINDKRLTALLAPLTLAEQKGIVRAFATERNMGLYHFYSLGSKDMGQMRALDDQRASALEALKENFHLMYDRNATSNILYLVYEPLIQRASLSLEEVSKLTLQNQLRDIGGVMQGVLNSQLTEKNAALFNKIGRSLLQIALPNSQSYLNRFYDAQTYMALVNAKHQLMQADASADKVGGFLQEKGAQMRNPYTQEFFQWDAATRQLSAPWLYLRKGIAGEEKSMVVHIELKTRQ